MLQHACAVGASVCDVTAVWRHLQQHSGLRPVEASVSGDSLVRCTGRALTRTASTCGRCDVRHARVMISDYQVEVWFGGTLWCLQAVGSSGLGRSVRCRALSCRRRRGGAAAPGQCGGDRDRVRDCTRPIHRLEESFFLLQEQGSGDATDETDGQVEEQEGGDATDESGYQVEVDRTGVTDLAEAGAEALAEAEEGEGGQREEATAYSPFAHVNMYNVLPDDDAGEDVERAAPRRSERIRRFPSEVYGTRIDSNSIDLRTLRRPSRARNDKWLSGGGVVWRYPLMSSGSRVQWPWPECQMQSIVLPAAARRGSRARAVWWWPWPRAGLHAANTPTSGSLSVATFRWRASAHRTAGNVLITAQCAQHRGR